MIVLKNMTNLLLYIQALQCRSIMALLQHAKVESDTVYVSDKDYSYAQHDFGSWYSLDVMAVLDTIIHNKFNCPCFRFIECPNKTIYYWDEEKRQYMDLRLK